MKPISVSCPVFPTFFLEYLEKLQRKSKKIASLMHQPNPKFFQIIGCT